VRLPSPTPRYSVTNEAQRNLTLELADNLNHKKSQDVEIGDGRLILQSPNGTRYQLTISNAGVVGATAL
jgi:hypothetical protein